jgi:hypothetical protein
MMLLLLVRLLFLVLVLVAMWLTPPLLLTHLLWNLLSSLSVASNDQYESIPDDEIILLVRKFCVLHRFHKERRRSPRGCFECGDTTHFIADCPK